MLKRFSLCFQPLLLALVCGMWGMAFMASAYGQSVVRTADGFVVEGAWARGGEGRLGAVVYLYLTNLSDTPKRLIKAETPRARWVEMQRTAEDRNGLMTLEPLSAVVVPAKSFVVMGPNALHLMLMGLDAPLQVDTEFPLTLHLEGQGPLNIKVRVMPSFFNPIDTYAGGVVLQEKPENRSKR